MKTLINGAKALKDGAANSFDLVKFINRNIVSGKIKVGSSANISSANITQGVLLPATSNRVVDLTSNTLTVLGTGVKNILTTNGIKEYGLKTQNSNVNLYRSATGQYSALTISDIGIFVDANSSAQINLYESSVLELISNQGYYKIGTDASTIPTIPTTDITPSNLIINPTTGEVYTKVLTPYFLSYTAASFGWTVIPTAFNVQNFVDNISLASRVAIQDRVIYFTGTNNASDPIMCAFYYGTDGKVIQIYEGRPFTYFTFSVSVSSLTNVNNGDKIGSLTLPTPFYANGNIFLKSISVSCASGIGTAEISLKNYSGTLIASPVTIDASVGVAFTNLGGVQINTNTFMLYLEVNDITDTVEMLSVTIALQ